MARPPAAGGEGSKMKPHGGASQAWILDQPFAWWAMSGAGNLCERDRPEPCSQKRSPAPRRSVRGSL